MPDNKWHIKMAVLISQDERNTGIGQILYPSRCWESHIYAVSDPNKYTNKIQGGRKDHPTSICACAGVAVWPKPGELSLWNALWLQEGTEQSSDTAYYGF